jgi:hypothetical protein
VIGSPMTDGLNINGFRLFQGVPEVDGHFLVSATVPGREARVRAYWRALEGVGTVL